MKCHKVNPAKVEAALDYQNSREIVLQSLNSRYDLTKESLRLLMLRNDVDPSIILSLKISHSCDENIETIKIQPGICDNSTSSFWLFCCCYEHQIHTKQNCIVVNDKIIPNNVNWLRLFRSLCPHWRWIGIFDNSKIWKITKSNGKQCCQTRCLKLFRSFFRYNSRREE